MPYSIIEATKYFSNGDYFSFGGFVGNNQGGGFFEVGQVVRPGDEHGWSEFNPYGDLDAFVIINSVENFDGSEVDHPDYLNDWGYYINSDGQFEYGPHRNSDLTVLEDSFYYSSNVALYYGSDVQGFLEVEASSITYNSINFDYFSLFLPQGRNLDQNSHIGSHCPSPCEIMPEYRGSDAADRLIGTDASERFWGGRGSDIIHAGDGDDFIYPGTSGSKRPDRLIGGSGRDTFFVGSDNKAIIKDFNVIDDQISLSYYAFDDYSWISKKRGSILINGHGDKVIALAGITDYNNVVVV